MPLDSKKLTIAGSPAPVLESVQVNVGGLAFFAVARNGSLAFKHGTGGESRTVGWTTREGVRQPLIDKPQWYVNPSLSPDGRRVAVQIDGAGGDSGGDSDVWVYDIEAKALSRLTFGGGRHTSPVWTPDGRRVIYAADTPDKVLNMFWTAADGTGQPEQLLRSRNEQIGTAVTPDGKTLVFEERGPSGKSAISFATLEGDRKPQIFLQSAFNEQRPALSPDGRWIAYQSDESGRYEIYVRPFPGPGGKWQISTHDGAGPFWSPKGRELYFYYRVDQRIMAATVETGSSFKHATPRSLFNYRAPVVTTFSISPDGQRFLLPQGSDASETNDIVVVLDWAQGLKSK